MSVQRTVNNGFRQLLRSIFRRALAMGGRPKRPRGGHLMTAAVVEEMVRELRAVGHAVDLPSPPLRPAALSRPYYSAAVAAAQAEAVDLQCAADVLAALRLTLALEVQQDDWLVFLHAHLNRSVALLRAEDAQFALATSKWAAAAEQMCSASRRSDATPLRRLEWLGQMDALHFALWDAGRRQETPLQRHPAGLCVSVCRALLSARPSAADGLRQLLSSTARMARAWDVRRAWARGGSGLPWRRGGCLLLRLMRSRWCEAVLLLHRSPHLDAADQKVRQRILAFLHVGRDLAARHMAFAIPNDAALKALARHALTTREKPDSCRGEERKRKRGDGGGGLAMRNGGLVELGAHNGYWAALARKEARLHAEFRPAIVALDISPPSRSWSRKMPVSFGSAEEVSASAASTLLICMPSPGETSLADDALESFHGTFVAYVGEWYSGMTGTRTFHAKLVRDFLLLERIALPNWPRMRPELFIFKRKAQPETLAGQGARDCGEVLACDVCGRNGFPLWRCPWTRQFRVCGIQCYENSTQMHHAVIAACFCGVRVTSRPALAEWDACEWLEAPTPAKLAGEASMKQWLALAAATPQPEA